MSPNEEWIDRVNFSKKVWHSLSCNLFLHQKNALYKLYNHKLLFWKCPAFQMFYYDVTKKCKLFCSSCFPFAFFFLSFLYFLFYIFISFDSFCKDFCWLYPFILIGVNFRKKSCFDTSKTFKKTFFNLLHSSLISM